MEIIHISAECYPVAKVGGLGDVVGSLPRYQNLLGAVSKVVMPCYHSRFLLEHEFETVHQGGIWLGPRWYHFNMLKEKYNILGFDLYLVDIPGLIEGELVYGNFNDTERFIAFQIATLDWINSWKHQPDIIHCHDHHSALVPFMLSNCYKYSYLSPIPTVLTIHNAQYQGWFGWDKYQLIPESDPWKTGLLDWHHGINSLAAGIKCCWALTTVSPSYLEELSWSANGLESLMASERGKSTGILNGIDSRVWNPATDPMIDQVFTSRTVTLGKQQNKGALCSRLGLDSEKPLVSFIGRLVYDKGADLLADIIGRSLYETDNGVNFLVLGSGDPHIEWLLQQARGRHGENFSLYLGYHEPLSHQTYAASDFLLMPSRVEPCGLNQLYSLRYGTLPMVRSIGGLKDTVPDFGDEGGYGIRFNHPSVWDACYSIGRALELYRDTRRFGALRRLMMKLDFSWDISAGKYLDLYKTLK